MQHEDMVKELESTGDYQVLKRLVPQYIFKNHDRELSEYKLGMIVDTETTGFHPPKDKIIEFAFLIFTYDEKTGEIYQVVKEYNSFDDPEEPIPEIINRITGIYDDDVKGYKIDDDLVNRVVPKCEIIIAHNSSFDRPHCEARLPIFKKVKWGCSWKSIDWSKEALATAKLEFLCYRSKFFFNAHRALIDCHALLNMMIRFPSSTGESVFKRVLDSAMQNMYLIKAIGAPYDQKNVLKGRGYQWDDGTKGGSKCWKISLEESKVGEELDFLKESVYQPQDFSKVKKIKITPYDRFSDREK